MAASSSPTFAMTVLNILTAAAIALPVYFVVATIYRLTVHPLAKYPGPLSWKLSTWPYLKAVKTGKRHIIMQDLHQKYGRIVRVGPNILSFNTAQAFHDITTDRNANVDKSGFIGVSRDISKPWHMQQIRNKQEHAQRRRMVGQAFTDSSLKSAEDFMQKQIRNWTDSLQVGASKSTDGWSETKDLGHSTNLLTLDVFGELCYGKSFEAVNTGDHAFLKQSEKGAKLVNEVTYLPINFIIQPILKTQAILKLLSPSAWEARWAMRNSLEQLVAARQQLEVDAEKNDVTIRKDFFHQVLKARDDAGQPLSLQTYTAEALLLTVAGTDTTSTALSSILFHLNRNPTKLAKLRAEVTAAFPTLDDIHTGPVLSSLSYLRACAEEGLRMAPPVPGPLTRRTLPGGAVVDDVHLPAGVDVEVLIYVLAHNEAYFPNASSYLPERWIAGAKLDGFGEVTDDLVSRQRSAFVPFSSGARSCLGTRMAYMEMGLVLARLVYMFDMRFDESVQPQTKDFETLDWFISHKEGPYLQFKVREGVVV